VARKRMEQVIVHALDQRWSWVLLGRDGRVHQHGRCVPGSPDWPEAPPLTVLIDAASCAAVAVELPDVAGRQMRQALRWAAEAQLAGSAEDEHVVAGPRLSDGRLACVAVASEVMHQLQTGLSGRVPEAMLPDALCLPNAPGQVSLAAIGDRVLVRWDEWGFGSFDGALADDMIEAVAGDDRQLVWYGGERPAWMQPDAEAADGDWTDVLARLAERIESPPINLLTEEWMPRSARAAKGHWRRAAALALVAGGTTLALALLEHYQLRQLSQTLDQRVEQRFAAVFPDVGRVVRPREQAERELARLRFGQAAGLFDLMHRVAPVVAGQGDFELERIDYRDGALEIGLRAPDVAALDQLEQRLHAVDLAAEVQSARIDEDGASGSIRIEERGG